MSRMRKHSAIFVLWDAKGFESEYGHTFSRTGRTNRAEKFLRATASKNVLGLNPNFVFELSDS